MVTLTFLENQKGLFHNLTTHFRMPVKQFTIFGCQGDGVPKAGPKTGGGGLATVPNLRVCEHPTRRGGTRRSEKGELTSSCKTVWSAWQKPPVSREGGRTGLPKKGKWSPRGTGNRQAPPIPAQQPAVYRWAVRGTRQVNRQGW